MAKSNKVTKKENLLDFENLKQLETVLRNIVNPSRRKILEIIAKEQPINVTAIFKQLEFDQSATSQHLMRLRQSNIVIGDKQGKEVFYSINEPVFEKINELSKFIINKK